MDNLTQDEKEILIEKLKTYVETDLDYKVAEVTNHFLFRFLRARKMHLENTKKMLKSYVEFQRSINANPSKFMKLDKDKFDFIRQQMYEGLFETDFEGQPVNYVLISKMDLEKLVKSVSVEDLINFMICRFERLTNIVFPMLSAKANKKIDRLTSVIDMRDVSPFFFIKGKPSEFCKEYFSVMQNFYPELLHKCFIINVSTFFSVLWIFIKPFLDVLTVSRIEVHKDKFLKVLQMTVPIKNVPICLGGLNGTDLRTYPGPWQPTYNLSIERQTWHLHEIEKEELEKISDKNLQKEIQELELQNQEKLKVLEEEEFQEELKNEPEQVFPEIKFEEPKISKEQLDSLSEADKKIVESLLGEEIGVGQKSSNEEKCEEVLGDKATKDKQVGENEESRKQETKNENESDLKTDESSKYK